MKKNSKIKTYYVSGMHCASCVTLLKDSLTELDDVEVVNVEQGKVKISVSNSFSLKYANAHVKDLGYTLSETPIIDSVDYLRILIVTIPVLILIWIMNTLSVPITSTQISIPTALVLGLIASTSTCLAVTGGLLLGLSTGVKFTISFLTGRLLGYTILGGILGAVGGIFAFSNTTTAVITVIVAFAMIMLGLSQLGVIPFLKFSVITSFLQKSKVQSSIGAFLIGVATFFLPCGFTQSLQLFAITTHSFISGALILGFFALGTIPGLLFIGSLNSIVSGKVRAYVMTFASVLIIALGLLTIPSAFTLYKLDKNQQVTTNNIVNAFEPQLVDGKQIVSFAVNGFSYSPNVLTLKKGVPVVLQIDGTKATGCARSILIPAFNVRTTLKSGITEVSFTPSKLGSFSFSCSMGMAGPGTINVIE
jgi:sulfite exporter TauE/SafE/copper chaperone CopZ